MTRKKVIMKNQILDAAYSIAKRDGLSLITARNVAKEIGCSTQPIYLEFENMDELKSVLLDKIQRQMSDKLMERKVTGNLFTDASLNYIDFSKNEKKLFEILFNANLLIVDLTKTESYQFLLESLVEDVTEQLTNEEIKTLFCDLWIVIHGLASLTTVGQVNNDDAANEKYIKRAKSGIIEAIKGSK